MRAWPPRVPNGSSGVSGRKHGLLGGEARSILTLERVDPALSYCEKGLNAAGSATSVRGHGRPLALRAFAGSQPAPSRRAWPAEVLKGSSKLSAGISGLTEGTTTTCRRQRRRVWSVGALGDLASAAPSWRNDARSTIPVMGVPGSTLERGILRPRQEEGAELEQGIVWLGARRTTGRSNGSARVPRGGR